MTILYDFMAKPIIKFAPTVLSPYLEVHKDKIEQVQNKLLSFIVYRLRLENSYHMTTGWLLSSLDWVLSTHWVYSNVNFMYKIVNG